MAWSLFGFHSGPLPVYIPCSTKETAETAGIMASSAITQNIPGPMVLPVSVARSWNQWLQQLAPRFNCPMASLAIACHCSQYSGQCCSCPFLAVNLTISFLLHLIVALHLFITIGFPDPGPPIFLREDNTEKLMVMLPSGGNPLPFPPVFYCFPAYRHVLASTLSPVATGVHPPAFADLLCHHCLPPKVLQS